MLFTLKNLGKLEEATIDLGKDLIVLTGPNNSSKTYVAHAIYGFCRSLGDLVREALRSGLTAEGDRVEVNLLAAVDREPLPADPLHPTPEELAAESAWQLSYNRDLLRALEVTYPPKLPEVLAAPQSFTSSANIALKLDKRATERGRLAILAEEKHEVLAPGLGPALDEQILVDKTSGNGVWTVTRVARGLGTRSSEHRSADSLRNLLLIHAAAALVRAMWPGLAEPHILTAERSAVEIFSRELAAKRFEPRGEDEPPFPYPLALADSLKFVQQMPSAQRATSPYAVEADRLEREILGGRVEIGPYGEMLFLPDGTKERLDMHLSSSSVKALAGLSFYIRHLAHKGRFLIIDEPELNLHPHNQRLVARLLARLARSGIKVLISTHSDYIIRELNNLLMLSADKDGKLREKYGYDEAETLSPERVGAYLFDGAHAHPIPIEPAGIGVAAMDKEVRELNRSSRDIYFSLFDQGKCNSASSSPSIWCASLRSRTAT
jgi:hypothetical protein